MTGVWIFVDKSKSRDTREELKKKCIRKREEGKLQELYNNYSVGVGRGRGWHERLFFVSVYGYNRYNKLIRLDTTRISSSFMCACFFLIINIIIFIFIEFKQTKKCFFFFLFFTFFFCFSQTIYVIRRWIMNRYSNLGGMSLISFSWTT